MTAVAQAADVTADEGAFLGQIRSPIEQTMGQGQSALWTMPEVATQYQPRQHTPAMQAALQAQQEGRFLDALILLDDAGKSGLASEDAKVEMNLLRASFLLQGHQPQQAIEVLAPLLGQTQHAADANALTAMAHLQQGEMREALEAANHAQSSGAQGLRDGMLPHLALSYALQGAGRLAEAQAVMHGFNTHAPQRAIALAREAELALTLGQIQSARTLVSQAQGVEAHPYVTAVSGLTYLINGQAGEAKAAFETALRRDPKDAKALLGLGLAEIKLGNLQEGQKKLQAANEAEPGNALILTYLGRSQQQLGQTEAARSSWHSAQQADPKDPTPWLYQAQAELQANRPLDARESLRQAQARTAYRSVYRGQRLLREDEQLLQANLAEIQRQLGMENLAFHTLSDSVGEKSAASLRNQADLLQGQRFGESARRSLLLQSQFNDRPGNLPAALDIYGDGAGQTGTSTPQHGAISALSAQQSSYNNYEELFSRRTALEADAIGGSRDTAGAQIRAGVGSETLGLGIAQRQYKTNGFAPFDNLDNRIAQAIVQWRPLPSTQVFVLQQTFHSQHGETINPAVFFGSFIKLTDNSELTRLGLRHTLGFGGELRALLSHQQTDLTNNYYDLVTYQPSNTIFGSSDAHSEEVQYRRSGTDYATQWGVQHTRGWTIFYPGFPTDTTLDTQQFYAAWQQTLNPQWQLDAQLGRGRMDNQDNVKVFRDISTHLERWLPRLGVVYTPDAATHVRVAAWRGMGISGLGDATLAPATLAGVVLARTGDNGQLVRATSLGLDRQLSPAWLLDAQAQRRKTDLPTIDGTGQQILVWQKVDESRLALHWQPENKPWTVSLAYDHERIRNDTVDAPFLALDSVDEQTLRSQQLNMRWFASTKATLNFTWSHNRVAGTQQTLSTPLTAYQNRFNQLDADLSWQFNGPRGVLSAGVRNARDVRFQYADTDRLNPRFSNGRLAYAKLKLAW